MVRRKSSPQADSEPQTPAEETIGLRLRQNAFVQSVLVKAGTVVQFPKAEAQRRLTTTQLWDIA